MNKPSLILASGSQIRATILKNAGVPFKIVKTDTDEASIKTQGLSARKTLREIATDLATAKALAVEAPKGTYVLGVDQIMEFEGNPYDKPTSLEEAHTRLMKLRGKPHTLINAAVLIENGSVVWQNIEQPMLWMRDYSEDELDRYFEACDESILKSVGAYQVEQLGVRLFDRIEGDYFAVLGLALSPLLSALREFNVVDF